MNKNKIFRIVSIPFLVFAIFVLSVSINKARAESYQTDNPNLMVQMMQRHHGANWKEDCTNVMNQLQSNSILTVI